MSPKASSLSYLAETGASPEDIGVWGMIIGGGLLLIVGIVVLSVYSKR